MEKNLRRTVSSIVSTNQSIRKTAKLSGYRRGAVTNFKVIVQDQGITLERIKELNDDELIKVFYPKKSYETKKRQPDWDYIVTRLKARHQTRYQLWEEYRSVDPQTAYGPSHFNSLLRMHLSRVDLTMRQIWYAGETVQVDFAGKRPYWFDQKTGDKRFVELFIGIMACSNYIFVAACPSQKLEDWIDMHIKMLTYFGGVPEEIIPDNLKSAVTKPGKIPLLNESYLDLATYYGFVINPARVARGQDKGKAEQAVLFVTRWITTVLKRRKFFSIEEINLAIAPLLKRLNQRPFKRMPGNRLEQFLELDKPLLKPLPQEDYQFGEWVSTQKVGRDYHIRYNHHAYSVPCQHAGEHVRVRVSRKIVEVYLSGHRIAAHLRSDTPNKYTTDKSHMPASHRSYAERSYGYFLEWASGLGSACADAVKEQFAGKVEDSPVACKACDKLQAFSRTYGNEAFEAACKKALALNSATATSIHNILKSKTYELQVEEPVQQQLPLHHNVRGSDYFTVGGSASC